VDVLRLLAPHPDEMGMGLTSAFQLTPEQSTAAIIMHHPQATYFSARRRNRLPEGAA
jgi:5-methyltetrahydrofolate--homocysteine methyltransferase